MSEEAIQPGFAFRSSLVDDGVFLFSHSCSIIEGEGLFRRFNRAGAFIEPDWYRFPVSSQLFTRAKEFDFT